MKLFAWIGIFVTLLLLVTCDRRHISVSTSQSWIENKNFAEIIRLSFPVSKCCNVFLNDDSMAVFEQFKNIYPYDYLLKRSNDECSGYFLLGSSDEDIMGFIKRIAPFMWKSEILIIVNNNVSRNFNIFHSSLYGFANVNIVSMSGSWKLSENYLKPRSFIEFDRQGEMQHNRGTNFQGRELQISSNYRPPMTYLNRTTQKTIDGVQAEVFEMDNELDWDGIEMRLFLIIAEKLNFTWSIRKPEGNYTYGRRINETVWNGGMIQMLLDGKIDIAFASIWVTLDQITFVQLTEPWYEVDIHFLVPRPRRTTSFWALTKPFSEEIWFLLATTLLFQSLYTYIRAWIDPNFPNQFRNFLITLVDLIGYFLNSTVPTNIAANKRQLVLWRTAGWLISTAYCSSLAARLASSDYESRIDTVEQFLEANLSWGAKQAEPFGDYFDLTNPNSAQLPSKYRSVETDEQQEQLIAAGNFAIPGQVINTCFFPDNFVSNENLKMYRLMREPLSHFQLAFAVQPWLLNNINMIILWLKETGITIWHLRDVTRRRNNYNLREVFIEHDGYDGNVQVLGLMPLAAGFSLLLIGTSIATLVFYLELKRAAASGSIRKLLQTIEKKREHRC